MTTRWLPRALGRVTVVALGLVTVVVVARLGRPQVEPVQRHHLAMGTVVTLSLYVDEEAANACFDLAIAEIDRVDSLLSAHRATSEVSRVNRRAPAGPVACGLELRQVLARSLDLARRTGGAVDVSLGALTHLWGFPDAGQPPEAAAVDSARRHVGHGLVELVGDSVAFRDPGLRLDLGAAAKGYCVDRAVAVLVAAGVEAGLVEAGGDIRCWGRKPNGAPWRFGVQHPREGERLVVVEDLGAAALATSGDYEQFFEFDGRRYHHLLDPSTGYPADGAVSATAWASSAMDADLLATAFFVMGPEAAISWAEAEPGVEALVFYERRGQLLHTASSGLQGRMQMPE